MFKEIILKSLLSIEFRPIALTRMMVDCRVNLHFWDTLILVSWEEGHMGSPKSIQREHIDSLFGSDHLQIVPQPNGGLRRFMHFHIKFHQSHAMMNVFHILVQLIEIFCWVPPATQIATMIFDIVDRIYVPSCLLAAAVLSGSEMF